MEKHYGIDEVFKMIGEENLTNNTVSTRNKKNIEVDGYTVYARSLRYMTFYQKGVKCACCGKEGKYFKLDGEEGSTRRHFNLYCEDGTLMTKDHIMPKSLGGADSVENMQPMCVDCNVAKGNGENKQFNIISIDQNGNVRKYKNIAWAVLTFAHDLDKKPREKPVLDIIENADMIRDAIKNGHVYRNRRWYMNDGSAPVQVDN